MLLVISGFRVPAWSAGNPAPEESSQIPGYVSKNGNTYVYQKVPLGDSTEPEYVFVWYLGEESSGPLIRYQDGPMTATLSCYENCRYVRWSRISEGKVISSGRIRVINDPLIHSIIRDATSGLLH